MCSSAVASILLMILPTLFFNGVSCTNYHHQSTLSTTHSLRKTPSAQAKGQELWCYSCDSMEDGDQCTEVPVNVSHLFRKCNSDEYYCTVKRISYTITTENSTTPPRVWSIQRQCSSSCGKGCIVIGERTKLYACTSCCESSLCNVGIGGGGVHLCSGLLLVVAVVLSWFGGRGRDWVDNIY